MTIHGVGIDVVEASRISRLLSQSGKRFEARWFTAEEIDQCRAQRDPVEAFARRLAAKEAVWKALGGVGGGPVPWRGIAVLESATPPTPRVQLTEAVAEWATLAGVVSIRVDWVTLDAILAAVAVAEGGPGSPITESAPPVPQSGSRDGAR